MSQDACSLPPGYADNATDCNDTDAAIHPGALEVCDGVDNKCAGGVDECFSLTTYYLDSDGDGYGDGSVSQDACSLPPGYADNATDCNEIGRASCRGRVEISVVAESLKKKKVDEGFSLTTYYLDSAGDVYGDGSVSTHDCSWRPGSA